MRVELKPAETTLRTEIAERMDKARKAFAEGRIGDDVSNAIYEAGERAHKLHMLLKERDREPKHHAYMIKNRELLPDHPEFYMHFHPIEDLLKFLEDEHANDDLVDQTLGAEFKFIVYSKRWNRDDTYRITRTDEGWDVQHISIGGPCDSTGRPFLFQNLDQDFIAYPAGLDWRFEWLWEQARIQGLPYNDVQYGLQALADWVTQTEKSAPTDGVWEGYP